MPGVDTLGKPRWLQADACACACPRGGPGRAWTAVTGAREAGAARGLVRERRPALAGLHARGRVRARPRLRAHVARRAAVHPGRRAHALAVEPARGGAPLALPAEWRGGRTPVAPVFCMHLAAFPRGTATGVARAYSCFWNEPKHVARRGPPAPLHTIHDSAPLAGQARLSRAACPPRPLSACTGHSKRTLPSAAPCTGPWCLPRGEPLSVA